METWIRRIGRRNVAPLALLALATACGGPTEPDRAAATAAGTISRGVPSQLSGHGIFPKKSGTLDVTLSWSSSPDPGQVYQPPALSFFIEQYEGPRKTSDTSTTSPIALSLSVSRLDVPLLAYPYTVRVVSRNNCGCTVNYVLVFEGPPMSVY